MGASMLAMAAAAAGMLIPRPIEPGTWIKTEDYPPQALRSVQRGYVLYRVVVSPEGRAVECDTVGSTALDKAVCRLIRERGRFHPAIGSNGLPSHGVYNGRVSFAVPGRNMPERPSTAEVLLTVDKLPDGMENPAYSTIVFEVDPGGKAFGCRAMEQELSPRTLPLHQLAQVACSQIPAAYKPKAARDETGKPVRSVQSVIFKFELAGVEGEGARK